MSSLPSASSPVEFAPSAPLAPSPPRIGCHVTPGGAQVLKALIHAQQDLEATALQVFAGGRINRSITLPAAADVEAFRERAGAGVEAGVGAGVGAGAGGGDMYMAVHAAYVVSLTAPPAEPLHEATVDYLVRALEWAGALGMDSVVAHPGSAKEQPPKVARANVAATVNEVLDDYAGPVRLLLENSAGDLRGRLVGRDLDELAEILAMCDTTRSGICLDTCHAFAGGYDTEQIAALPEAYPQIGLVHFNVPAPNVSLGSCKDRHGVFDETCWEEPTTSGLARALMVLPLVMETKQVADLQLLRAWLT